MTKLTYSDIPHDWAICYQSDCPLSAQCLRHHAALLAPANLLHHDLVLPAARHDDDCQAFVPNEPVTLAYGMKNLYDDLKPWDIPRVRMDVEEIFGNQRRYYRFREGRYPILPEQQAQVADIFRRNGYTSEPQFDRTETTYYFPKVTK